MDHTWLLSPPRPDVAVRLFCFPYAGGGPQLFRGWPARLPGEIDVCSVVLPGQGMRRREAPFTRLAPLVAAAADGLRPYLDRPFALFGHSLGGLVAFELARTLQQAYGLSPAWLFVSACRMPRLPNPRPPIHHLPEADFIRELRTMGGTPELVLNDPDLMRLFLPSLRADLAVWETYPFSEGARLDCPLSVFGGDRDDRATRSELAAWRELTTGPFSLQLVPGDHFFIRDAPGPLLSALARDLQTVLHDGAGRPDTRDT